MGRTVGIGHQDFGKLRMKNNFYVDKTGFIKEWWESDDEVTLITRPRRFGKTLNMSMVEQFFSCNYAGKAAPFEGLFIWEDKKYRDLQGTYPVIALSFSDIKEPTYEGARKKICKIIQLMFNRFRFLLEGELLSEKEKSDFHRISADMEDYMASLSLKMLSEYMYRYYGKNVIILLDEYDTPMQEAFMHGYWTEMAEFTRSLFNSSFKTNPYLERAIMTGITRVSKESIFSDLNNLKVVTTTSLKYGDCFGFTEKEVFDALDEFGLIDKKCSVKDWYDGFTFGNISDIYNPWSIINYLDTGRFDTYWANTSSNNLVGKLIRESAPGLKQIFEELLCGRTLTTELDEQIVYDQLGEDEQAIWSLLLAGGYLKIKSYKLPADECGTWNPSYILELTNFEVRVMFQKMVLGWFRRSIANYNGFIQMLLQDNLKLMNIYMNRMTSEIFSYFDTGKRPSSSEPERFYHGFVLGLIVELSDRYVITSNRESGFGRYDVMLEPKEPKDDAIIMEFKVQEPEDEKELSDTVNSALRQIREKDYAAALKAKGIPKAHVRSYGFAFCGKQVLIGAGHYVRDVEIADEIQDADISSDEMAIHMFIENGQEFGASRAEILQKMMKKFDLTQRTAEQKISKYWKD